MTILQSIILGIVQGITEFLPISSSGHLILIPKVFNWQDQGLIFDAIVHLATALAIIYVLRKEIKEILFGLFKAENKIWIYILIGIIPAGIAGLFLDNIIENKFRSVELVAFNLIFWGFVLWLAEKYSDNIQQKISNIKNIKIKQTLIIGFAQILALFPGTSRSGITITAGLFSKLNKKSAVNFSFLLSLPLILAAGGLKISEAVNNGALQTNLLPLIFGFLASLISGIFAIKFLLYLVKTKGFKIFVIYRILLGIILLLFLIYN
ncbi:MAG: undecaprenyl-diphosphate phosphatase [Patescibacteria group bacterium]